MCKNRGYLKSFYRFSQEQLMDRSFLNYHLKRKTFSRDTKYTHSDKEITQ